MNNEQHSRGRRRSMVCFHLIKVGETFSERPHKAPPAATSFAASYLHGKASLLELGREKAKRGKAHFTVCRVQADTAAKQSHTVGESALGVKSEY